MGVYYMYVCVDAAGACRAHFNPQHGFGGLKWGEYIGTPLGDRLMHLLQTEFTPNGCRWGIASDAGFQTPGLSDNDLYEELHRTNDFALNEALRARALNLKLTTPETLDLMDGIQREVERFVRASRADEACCAQFTAASL